VPLQAVNWLSAHSLLDTFGTAGVIAIIFAETGLLLGVFFPGDSLLVTAGIAAGGGLPGLHPPVWALLVGAPIAAVLGGECGYLLGKRAGPYLFRRPDARLFRHEYVERAAAFLERFGWARALVLSRFVPIVRTFVNPVAGVVGVPAGMFVVWNTVGGVVWAAGIVGIGYWLGSSVSGIDHYLLPAVVVVIALSLLPIAREVWRNRPASREADRRPGSDPRGGRAEPERRPGDAPKG